MNAGKKKEKKLSREEALQLYQDLQASMHSLLKQKVPPKGKVPENPAVMMAERKRVMEQMPMDSTAGSDRGAQRAVAFLALCALLKIGVSVIDYLGMGEVAPAHAVVDRRTEIAVSATRPIGGEVSREEMQLLTSLDKRRSELEVRSRRLDEREADLARRDKEYVMKLTELKELTDRLKDNREKDEKKKNTQLDQLANVYGAMNPQEAAQLIEQLDITIALPLLQRMSEKRMGQILPLMTPERALVITKMLSGSK